MGNTGELALKVFGVLSVISRDLILIYRIELPVWIAGIHCISHISEEYVYDSLSDRISSSEGSDNWDGFEFSLISCSDLKNQMREFLVLVV